jgi:phosphoribosyl-ATP pyrophosphohydrolase/phosphoribosyl-AMP cyclohydrolase
MRHEELKWDRAGLVPAIVQDEATGKILMLAYVSKESLAKTAELRQTVFFSRSRQTLWHKGDTSGNFQHVVSLTTDCDADTLLIRVRPEGPACHTGAESCFFEPVEGFEPHAPDIGEMLGELERVVAGRKSASPDQSYTARLLAEGRPRILQKVGEEAVECVVAGMAGDREGIKRETSDLLYHLIVALQEQGISLSEIAEELKSRRR